MTAFDAHAHVIVPGLLRDLAALRAREPERVPVLGAVPLQDPDLAAADPVATVRAAGLDGAARSALLHANAERELRRVPVAGGPGG
jgi:hypothetical protein